MTSAGPCRWQSADAEFYASIRRSKQWLALSSSPRNRKRVKPGVAASADSVKKLCALGLKVVVQKGAGAGSQIPDADFAEAGAKLGTATGAKTADIVLKVQRPTDAEIKGYKKGATVHCDHGPLRSR